MCVFLGHNVNLMSSCCYNDQVVKHSGGVHIFVDTTRPKTGVSGHRGHQWIDAYTTDKRHTGRTVYELEMQVFERKMCLDNAGGLHPCSQHVLLRGNIIRLRDTIQRIQITAIITLTLLGYIKIHAKVNSVFRTSLGFRSSSRSFAVTIW